MRRVVNGGTFMVFILDHSDTARSSHGSHHVSHPTRPHFQTSRYAVPRSLSWPCMENVFWSSCLCVRTVRGLSADSKQDGSRVSTR